MSTAGGDAILPPNFAGRGQTRREIWAANLTLQSPYRRRIRSRRAVCSLQSLLRRLADAASRANLSRAASCRGKNNVTLSVGAGAGSIVARSRNSSSQRVTTMNRLLSAVAAIAVVLAVAESARCAGLSGLLSRTGDDLLRTGAGRRRPRTDHRLLSDDGVLSDDGLLSDGGGHDALSPADRRNGHALALRESADVRVSRRRRRTIRRGRFGI